MKAIENFEFVLRHELETQVEKEKEREKVRKEVREVYYRAGAPNLGVPRTSSSDLLPPLVRQTKGQLQTEAPDPPRKSSLRARSSQVRANHKRAAPAGSSTPRIPTPKNFETV